MWTLINVWRETVFCTAPSPSPGYWCGLLQNQAGLYPETAPLHPWVQCIQLQTILYLFLCCLPREQGDPFPRAEIISHLVAVTPSRPIAESKDAQGRKCGAVGGSESEGSEIAFLTFLGKILILTSHLLTLVLQILTMMLVALCTCRGCRIGDEEKICSVIMSQPNTFFLSHQKNSISLPASSWSLSVNRFIFSGGALSWRHVKIF